MGKDHKRLFFVAFCISHAFVEDYTGAHKLGSCHCNPRGRIGLPPRSVQFLLDLLLPSAYSHCLITTLEVRISTPVLGQINLGANRQGADVTQKSYVTFQSLFRL